MELNHVRSVHRSVEQPGKCPRKHVRTDHLETSPIERGFPPGTPADDAPFTATRQVATQKYSLRNRPRYKVFLLLSACNRSYAPSNERCSKVTDGS